MIQARHRAIRDAIRSVCVGAVVVSGAQSSVGVGDADKGSATRAPPPGMLSLECGYYPTPVFVPKDVYKRASKGGAVSGNGFYIVYGKVYHSKGCFDMSTED